MTDADIAALTRRLAGTAVDYKELYEAAKRDAEEAEAYAAELEGKLAKLERAAKPFAAIKIKDGMSQPGEIGRTDVTNIRAALAELKGQKDE